MYESEDRMVSHPDHYISETGMEVIDVIEAFTSDLKGLTLPIPQTSSNTLGVGRRKTESRIWRKFFGTRSI